MIPYIGKSIISFDVKDNEDKQSEILTMIE
jgi:hypothetical protein